MADSSSGSIDLPDPRLAPEDFDLIALGYVDSSGHELTSDPMPQWPVLTRFGSKWNSEVLIAAYQRGMFPMPFEIDGGTFTIGWWSPQPRAIFIPETVIASRSLRKSMKNFSFSVDKDFTGVMRACANPDRPSGWINEQVIESFTQLHRQGLAHSIEVRNLEGDLVGGLYGVEVGGVFAGESMFHTQRDASKAALVHLAQIMSFGSGRVIDTQWMTTHLESLGAVEIARNDYCDLVESLQDFPSAFAASNLTIQRKRYL